jgi:hypothetical protein
MSEGSQYRRGTAHCVLYRHCFVCAVCEGTTAKQQKQQTAAKTARGKKELAPCLLQNAATTTASSENRFYFHS